MRAALALVSSRQGCSARRGPQAPLPARSQLLCLQGTRRRTRTARSSSTACRRADTWSMPTSTEDGLIATKPENEVEVGPGAVATVEIPLQRLPTITGRVVDARTGKGDRRDRPSTPCGAKQGRNLLVGEATTDAEGRYTIPARPGKIRDRAQRRCRRPISDSMPANTPSSEVEGRPELARPEARPRDRPRRHRRRRAGHPVAGAEVFLLAAIARESAARRADPDGPRRHVPLRPARPRRHGAALGPGRRCDDRRHGRGPAQGGQGQGHAHGRPEVRRPDPRPGDRQQRPADRGGQGHALVDAPLRPPERRPADDGRGQQHAGDVHDRRERLVRLPGPLAGRRTTSWSRPGGTARPSRPR